MIQYQFEKINQAEYSDDRNHNLGDGAGLDRGMKDFLFFFFLSIRVFLSIRGPLAVFLLYGQTYRVTIRRLGPGIPYIPLRVCGSPDANLHTAFAVALSVSCEGTSPGYRSHPRTAANWPKRPSGAVRSSARSMCL